MTTTLTINRYYDSGHSWGKVSISKLIELGIADKITPYSYMRGMCAYLEEDNDLSLLVDALQANHITPKFKNHCSNKRSKIRGYHSYYFDLAVMTTNPESEERVTTANHRSPFGPGA